MTTEIFTNLLKQFSRESAVFILAMLPVFELRGAIPIAIFQYHLAPLNSYLLSIIGNILPIIFVLLFMLLFVLVFTTAAFAGPPRKCPIREKATLIK